jgi:hypothetical protein
MSDIMKELREEDLLIQAKQDSIQPGDSQSFLESLMERHRLYLKYEDRAFTAGDISRQSMINAMKENIFLQIMIYKLRVELEGDIAKILVVLMIKKQGFKT